LAGPALERLVRLQERALGLPERPETRFLVDIGRSLQSMLISWAIAIPPLLLLFLLDVVIPPAVIVTVPLKLLVTAYAIAWDMCDYPLSVQGLRVADRVRLIARHWSAVLGFSLALALAALVPCLPLLLLPGGVVGATRLVAELQRHDRASCPSRKCRPW
jgi:CysZ protein